MCVIEVLVFDPLGTPIELPTVGGSLGVPCVQGEVQMAGRERVPNPRPTLLESLVAVELGDFDLRRCIGPTARTNADILARDFVVGSTHMSPGSVSDARGGFYPAIEVGEQRYALLHDAGTDCFSRTHVVLIPDSGINFARQVVEMPEEDASSEPAA